jgi:hypothetical protein
MSRPALDVYMGRAAFRRRRGKAGDVEDVTRDAPGDFAAEAYFRRRESVSNITQEWIANDDCQRRSHVV